MSRFQGLALALTTRALPASIAVTKYTPVGEREPALHVLGTGGPLGGEAIAMLSDTIVSSPRTFGLMVALMLWPLPAALSAQHAPGADHSSNMRLVAHVPLGVANSVADVEIEQDVNRPYVYVSRLEYREQGEKGFDIVRLADQDDSRVIYRWRIENQDLHEPTGGMDGKYFELDGRYYYVQSFQFGQGGPDHDLGAVVFDVTGLPDPTKIREVGRIRYPEIPGGFHNIFAYKHSSGRTLLFATVESPIDTAYGANIYDMARFLAGDSASGLIGHVPLPGPRGAQRGYHDMYVAYLPASGQDRFYGGGPEVTYLGGNYVYDVTDLEHPRLLATVKAQEGQQAGGHTFVATPDGRYVLTEMNSLAHAPIRIYDIGPALAGEQPIVKMPVGAWTFDWTKSAHNIEMRWPYAFVSAYTGGLRVIDIRDPTEPVEVAFWDTYDRRTPYMGGSTAYGMFGVDVRNADGLIVGSDMHSGLWAFRLEGFNGWNGHDWGVPDVSSVQDWTRSPGAAANDKEPRP